MNGTILAFLGTAALVIVTPGPDTAMTIKNALRYGRRGAFLSPLGTGSAILVHATVAALGFSEMMNTQNREMKAVKQKQEILALSKMNWNNTQFDGADPIALAAARKVSDVLEISFSEAEKFHPVPTVLAGDRLPPDFLRPCARAGALPPERDRQGRLFRADVRDRGAAVGAAPLARRCGLHGTAPRQRPRRLLRALRR